MERGRYTTGVLALFHGLALFVALNAVAWLALQAMPDDPVTFTYGPRSLGTVYPGRTREEVRDLLGETWHRPAAFKPFTVTGERRYRGRFVNVDAAGFRQSRDQGPWPPDPARANVFVFGGSTTFSYGVADDETVVSGLQAWLGPRLGPRRLACYNFGSAGYYSTQERILLQELLAAGHLPHLAVFIDGLNEFAIAVPWPSAILRRAMDAPVSSAIKVLTGELPLATLVERWKARRMPRRRPEELASAYDDPALLERRIERYLANRRLITATAAAYGVPVLFVVQPVPTYHYQLRYHLFGDFDFQQNNYSAFGYPRLAERLRREPPGRDLLWAADMQDRVSEPLYVDEIHYTAAMCGRVGEEVGRAILERGLLRGLSPGPGPAASGPAAATRHPSGSG